MSWKQLSSEEKYRNPWMYITEDKVETDAGKVLTWGVVHKPPCAMVVPWDGKQFVLVGLYRYCRDDFSWEFPSGVVDEQNMQEGAKRELKEESGFEAKTYKHLGKFYLANGTMDQSMELFVATDLTEGVAEPDAGEEGIQSKRVTFDELRQMINDGTIKDGPTITALGYLYTTGWVSENIGWIV